MAQNMDFVKTCTERYLDKYKESFGAEPFGERTAMSRAKIKGKSRVRQDRNLGNEGIISNCSEIHIESNTVAVIYSNGKIERIINKPGVYVYFINGPVSRNTPAEIMKVALRNKQVYGFHPEEEKKVTFVNLRELRGIKFGTGAIPYHDRQFDLDLEIMAYGEYGVQITDPRKFIENFVPAGVYTSSFDEEETIAPLRSEIAHSLAAAISKMSENHRITDMTACSNELLKAICQDTEHVGAWESKYGFRLSNIVLKGIKYSESSQVLVDEFNEKRLPFNALNDVSEQSSSMAIKHQVAAALYKNGFSTGAELSMMNQNGLPIPVASSSNSSAEIVKALTANTSLAEMEQKIVMIEKLGEMKKTSSISEEIYNRMMAQVVGL